MNNTLWLRRFSKLTCFSTLFLIFAGSMVTSTGSGLSVPDWPLSYGMIFPPMVGGVFYEHGHRTIATVVGFFTLCLAIWLGLKENRKWVKVLGYCALGAVMTQGILGGITVLFFLPTAVSVGHGILAQSFFIMTIVIAYSLSVEREQRKHLGYKFQSVAVYFTFGFILLIFIQLILGAVMRHTGSGLAIYDFPKMAGSWWPAFDQKMLLNINDWRFEQNLDPVKMPQVVYHFLHRVGALLIFIGTAFLNAIGLINFRQHKKILKLIYFIDFLVTLQIVLGVLTVLSVKSPLITSIHVVTGATILGLSVLLLLRMLPLTIKELKSELVH